MACLLEKVPVSDVNEVSSTPQVGQRLHMPKMAELIGGSLRRQIVRGDLKEGDALPSEAALMEQFGVSRPTLREAFRVLESEALITIRRGAHGGARVKVPDASVAARYAGLVLEYRGTTLSDVFDARSVLESSCAKMAAIRHDADDIARLCAIKEDILRTPTDLVRIIPLHGEFGAQVVKASGNETMNVLGGVLRTIIDASMLKSVLATESTPESIGAFDAAHRSHARLIDLLIAGDADGAERHWRRHLDTSRDYVLATSVAGHSVLDLM